MDEDMFWRYPSLHKIFRNVANIRDAQTFYLQLSIRTLSHEEESMDNPSKGLVTSLSPAIKN